MKIAVVINSSSGTCDHESDSRERQIRDAFAAAGATAAIHCIKPDELESRARELARDVDVMVAAGGDGTVSAVAGAVAGSDVAIGVLPMGTLNHFAKDVGVPLDLADAAAAIVAGRTRAIDVGEVNGRVFVNNSSIGLYPETVIHRDRERATKGRGKWTAMAMAAFRVLRRFPLLRACVTTPDGSLTAATPLIFVGNNPYTINVLELGERERLDCGQLSLYTMRCKGRLHMFWLMVRAILGRLDAVKDFAAFSTDEIVVRLRQRRLDVAVDGEVVRMQSPLRYRIRPGALRVVVPA